MLFATVYTPRGTGSEEEAKRILQIWSQWKQPAGMEIKAFYVLADQSGGIIISEASTAAAVLEAISPFAPYLDYNVTPIVEITEAVPILQRVNAWRDSVG